ncbi:hypothetical protein JAAARDRAFT_33855 [Jaapia argillacea MUCL 33604]|uniref:Uncharacterized protein n=1 Tax=Jaapia argillacea MUCL 33604 TaxID=933084 RepID=A0A067PWC3_9AGAM|nr:hypothetical protein JAAARDRAFT_33855 [Jaapia argillacea MUCL 33604]
MATPMVERPLSVIPERRPRSPEIIDVDAFDSDEIQFVGHSFHQAHPPRPPQRRRINPSGEGASASTSIFISDSDDEPPTPGRPNAGPSRAPNYSFRIFPPPPPPMNTFVPPVPPLPPQHAGQSSFPMRRRPPPHPRHASGVIRPIEQPFDFEAHIEPPPPPPRQPPLIPAPRSHHQPVMGLGGALISLNRQNMIQEGIARQRRERERFRRTWQLPSFTEASGYISDAFRRFSDFRAAHGDDDVLDFFTGSDWYNEPFIDEADALDDPEAGAGMAPYLFGMPRRGANRRPLYRREDPDYKQSYTHPGPPSAGFTFDFGPPPPTDSILVLDDSPGPSSSASASSSSQSDEANVILVCAHCLDPLVLGGGVSDEGERLKKKVWGLRCGHMLDGKCIDDMMKPSSHPPTDIVVDDGASSMDRNGKGKGKGKAKEVQEEVKDFQPSTSVTQHPDDNSMRSRLRPRYPGASSSHTHPHAPVTVPSPPDDTSRPARRPPTSRRRRLTQSLPSRARGKGKGKAQQPIVEAEHEWKCPVTGCGRVHVSLLIDGQWVMDKERGAIGIYV